MTDAEQPPPERPATSPASRRGHRVRDSFIQLFTITVGVLIALFFEGLVEWNQNRALVREARATISRELADNKREADGELASIGARAKNLETALQMTNELLTTKKSEIRKLELGISFAELREASWRTAERTGALAHMDYADVREYSRVYDFQQVYTAHQRRAMERLAGALAILAEGDPHQAAARDLETFRQHVLALRADMIMEEQFLRGLSEMYQATLTRLAGQSDGRTDTTAR